jgi:hypothetical protein
VRVWSRRLQSDLPLDGVYNQQLDTFLVSDISALMQTCYLVLFAPRHSAPRDRASNSRYICVKNVEVLFLPVRVSRSLLHSPMDISGAATAVLLVSKLDRLSSGSMANIPHYHRVYSRSRAENNSSRGIYLYTTLRTAYHPPHTPPQKVSSMWASM